MKRKNAIFALCFVLLFGVHIFAQDDFEAARKAGWKAFNKQNWQKFDFSTRRLNKAQLGKLKTQTDVNNGNAVVSELELLRGVVFGKRGRMFKENAIQDYLQTQAWYKPKADFSNAVLTKTERDNLDLIRLAEAAHHETIEPGDMRVWENKLIADENLGSYSPAELSVLIAEIEAIHGKTFTDEKWIQNYFDERYWYQPNAKYSPNVLNDFERKNLERLLAEKSAGRNTAISIGDMDKFQTVALTDDKLNGLSMMELRMIRNEFWARAGRKFETPGVRQYFEWRDWYKPLKDQRKVKLNEIEEANVNLILAREAKIRANLGTEVLPEDGLGELFTEDLRVLRNEIFARHGRVFKDPQLQKYFEAQPWYQANPEFTDDSLNEIEYQNLALIKQAEESAISKLSEVEG